MSCTSITTNDPRQPISGPARGDRGSAIMLVVAIGALVTLLVFTWVMFSVKRYHAVIDTRDDIRARYAAESVISQVVYEKTINPNDDLKKHDSVLINSAEDTSELIDDPLTYTDSIHGSSATATAEEEGSYFRVKAEGKAGKAACDIDALFGIELPEAYRFALIQAHADLLPLDIRRGQIIGDALLPKPPGGPIRGNVSHDIANNPNVDETKFLKEIEAFERKLQIGDSGETVLPTTQTFTDKSPLSVNQDKSLFVNGNILIENRSHKPLSVNGPGVIIATGDIQISGSVVINNVEILAVGNVQCFDNARLRKVTIYSRQMIGLGDKVTFSGNLYALKKLVMAGQAATEMPTFAHVKGDTAGAAITNYGLQLTQQSRFTGTFFCKGEHTVSLVERDTRFTGLFYSRGHLILEGTVFGCVVSNMLVERVEDVADKRNILAGGTINRKNLPRNFIVPCAFTQSGAAFRLVSWTMSPPDPADAESKEAGE